MRLSALIVILIVTLGCDHKPVLDASAYDGPITAKLENDGRFANGSSWSLELDADQTVRLKIGDYSSDTTRTFKATDIQIEQLRELLLKQRFFELDDEYGQIVPDGSTQRMTIACGDQSHTVQLHFLINWVHGDTSRLREPARAVRVWRYIRTWFDDKEAVDLKRYDDMVLDAAPS
jgi:hypothetical protein